MKDKTMKSKVKMITSMLLQVLAVAGILINKSLGLGLQAVCLLYMALWVADTLKSKKEYRVCEKCGTEFVKQYRVCPNCGNVCEAADAEKELTEVMKKESECELEETPEELERNFARVQEINLENALALGEDDIEGILLEKMQSDDTDV